MSQIGSLAIVSSLGAVDTLTGNTGGTVSPDGGGNINVVGGNNITTVGNGSPNTLTVNVSGTTNHAVQIGNASGSLTSIPVGTNGQVIVGATGADPSFATLTSTGGTITFTLGANTLNLEAAAAAASAITYQARSSSGSITKGQLVQINGFNGGLSLPLVHLADSDTSNVPVHGMALTAFDTVTTGTVQITGLITGVNTNAMPSGTVLYLQSTPGTYGINAPDGEINNINPIGSVVKSDATTGSILLNCPANVVQAPNLDEHNVFIGDSDGVTITATLSNGIQTYNTGSHTFSGSTITQNGSLYGGASNTVSSTSVGTNGQVLLGATAAAPAFGTLTSTGGTITFTTGANSLNLETAGAVPSVFHTGSGDATPSAGALTIAGGNNISTSGAGSTVTVAVSGTNNHALQVGNASGSLTSLSIGTTNTVLLGNTGADPSFGAVPNAALANSSITLTNGSNITVTGSPVALGGAATIAVSGTTNHSVQIGNSGGSLTSAAVGTNGQVLIGATTADPAFATLTSTGGTVVFTTGANTLNLEVAGGGIAWTEVTGTTQAIAVNNGYIANNGGLVTLTLPATAALGSNVRVTGKGAGGWRIAQNSGQTVFFGNTATTTGATGHLDSTATRDTIELVCVTANNDWNVLSSIGNLTVV